MYFSDDFGTLTMCKVQLHVNNMNRNNIGIFVSLEQQVFMLFLAHPSKAQGELLVSYFVHSLYVRSSKIQQTI